MKNKKGFTLVEIIAVIALIAVIVGIFIVNLVGKNDSKENNKDTVKQILSAADAYVSANRSEIEKLYEGYNFVDITIGELKGDGLLSEDITNKETNEKYKDDEVVRVTLNGSTGATEFELNPADEANTYLVTDTIYLSYDASGSKWCNGDNEFKGLNGSDPKYGKLVLTDLNDASKTYDLVKDDSIKVTSCDVDVTKAGTYSIVYSYTYNGKSVSKTRNVYVAASETDVDSFTAYLNKNGNKVILGAKDTNITIIVTYKNGTKKEITSPVDNITDFSVKDFVTEPIGSKKAIVSYNKTNSDGSVPSPFTLNYVVSDSLVDFINDDCIPVAAKSDVCYYVGEVESNYLKYETNPNIMFRIYYKNGTSIKVIANDPYTYNGETDLAYGMIGACKSSGCCNGGRYYYQGLAGKSSGSDSNFTSPMMSSIVNAFYNDVGDNSSPKYTVNQVIKSGLNTSNSYNIKVALMTKNDYNKIAKCNGNDCFVSYLTNKSNAKKNFWLVETTGYEMDTSNFNYGKSEAYVRNNYVNATSYGVDSGGAYKGYSSSQDTSSKLVVQDKFKVRPTLQLKNAKIISGDGTSTNPFIVR